MGEAVFLSSFRGYVHGITVREQQTTSQKRLNCPVVILVKVIVKITPENLPNILLFGSPYSCGM